MGLNFPYKMGMGRESELKNLAIKAIQGELKHHSVPDPGVIDGLFGAKTKASVVGFQRATSLYADGVVGPMTAERLWRNLIHSLEAAVGIPPHYFHGMIKNESLFDPGAVGPNGRDTGLVQINLDAHPEVSLQQSMDPGFALPWAHKRFMDAHAAFASGPHPEVAWECAIAQHNSPAWAYTWSRTGSAPNSTIQAYVNRVKQD